MNSDIGKLELKEWNGKMVNADESLMQGESSLLRVPRSNKCIDQLTPEEDRTTEDPYEHKMKGYYRLVADASHQTLLLKQVPISCI